MFCLHVLYQNVEAHMIQSCYKAELALFFSLFTFQEVPEHQPKNDDNDRPGVPSVQQDRNIFPALDFSVSITPYDFSLDGVSFHDPRYGTVAMNRGYACTCPN